MKFCNKQDFFLKKFKVFSLSGYKNCSRIFLKQFRFNVDKKKLGKVEKQHTITPCISMCFQIKKFIENRVNKLFYLHYDQSQG